MEADPSLRISSKQDSSPPQARAEPPSKEKILAAAREGIASLEETLQKQFGTKEVDEETKKALVKSLNYTCDVYLANQNLVDLPPELTDILKHGVTRITLAHNRLTEISSLSKGFIDCTSLKYVVLRSNELKEFPEACFSLPNLELLDLKRNQIESLPEDLDRMKSLRVLSVVRNKIQRLPVCIGQMKQLHQFATRRNPIVFPPKEYWAIENNAEDDANVEERDKEKNRDMNETKSIKKFLQDYQNREREKKEGESEMSESNVETPRPARRKASGRFPIKPSVSGIEYNTESIPASPMLPKPPPLPSKSFARTANQPISTTLRPAGVTPLITSNERNRSNSESQMPTSVREKRMGIIPRKVVDPDKLEIRRSNRLSHLRGLSHGSALQNSSVPPVSDSSSPTSPVDGDFQRRMFSRRLSSLPEGKRKSRMEDPHVELARGLLYSLNQIYGPIRDLVKVLRGASTKRTSVERTYYNAFSFMEELGRKLTLLESREEENEEDDKRHSTASIHDSCVTCIKTFEQLAFALKKNLKALVAQSNPQMVRTLMHLLYASLIEVRNSCVKLGDVDLRPVSGEEYREFDRGRQASPTQRRPVTSLRVRDQQSSMINNGRLNGMHGLQSTQNISTFSDTTRMAGNSSNSSLSSTAFRGMDQHAPYGITTPTLSRSNTLGSLDEGEPLQSDRISRQFDHIWHKLQAASELVVDVLPNCITLLSNARAVAKSRSNEMEIGAYDQLLDRCKHVRDATEGLRRWLVSIKDYSLSNQREFWSAVTVFTREYIIFADNVREGAAKSASFPYEIRTLLKPMHAVVKDISRVINNSPWSHLASINPQQQQKSPYPQNFATTQAHSQPYPIPGSHHPHGNYPAHPQLSLQTRSPVPPPNPSDPTSAVSMVSSNGNSGVSSGHVTPLPATPMSAALGPAALATMPMIPDLPTSTQPLGAGFFASGSTTGGSGAEQPPTTTVERSRSVSQRR